MSLDIVQYVSTGKIQGSWCSQRPRVLSMGQSPLFEEDRYAMVGLLGVFWTSDDAGSA